MRLCLLAPVALSQQELVGSEDVWDTEHVVQYKAYQASWNADETDNIVYEATFKKRQWNDAREGYTFDEVKAFCDGLGGGYKVPTPTTKHEDNGLIRLRQVTGDFFLGFTKYKNGVYQRGKILYDVYTLEPAGLNYEQPGWDWDSRGAPWSKFSVRGLQPGEHPNFPGSNDWEVYRYVMFTSTNVRRVMEPQWDYVSWDHPKWPSLGAKRLSADGNIRLNAAVCTRTCTGNDECELDPAKQACSVSDWTNDAEPDTHAEMLEHSEYGTRHDYHQYLRCSPGYFCPKMVIGQTTLPICRPCGDEPSNVCKSIPWLNPEYYLACEENCNAHPYPADYIQKTTEKSHPDIVTFADEILKKGCYRGGKPCDAPINGMKNKLKGAVRKLVSQHGKYARNRACASGRYKGENVIRPDGLYISDNYNVPYEYDPTFEITRDNFEVENWIDQDTEVFDGCAAFQKVLDALFNWGVHYDRGCHHKWTEAKKELWFKTYWKKQIRSYQTILNSKLSNPSTDEGVFLNCQLNNGFDN